jgi:hypothetical protein
LFPLSRNFLKFAAVGAFVALTAASTPAQAVELVDNLGPVGPSEPILAWVGSKRFIAFYVPGSGNCAVHVVVWDPKDVNAESTVGFDATLDPGQTTSIDRAENKSLLLRCGAYAESLAVVDTDHQVASK